jgi:hypothetical protein
MYWFFPRSFQKDCRAKNGLSMGFSRNVSGTAGLEEISGGVFSAMVGRDSVSDHLCRRGKVQKNDPEQVFHWVFLGSSVLFFFSSWTITRIWDCQGCQKNVCAFVQDRDRNMYRSRMASMPRAISKKALLVGCNYPGSGPVELTGCWNDVRVTRDRLINRFGFQTHYICLLVDLPHRSPQPTWAVIKQHLRLLFRDMQAGDVLVFQFFGQSVRQILVASQVQTTSAYCRYDSNSSFCQK